ncbi:MAG TPA: hypothetical protein VGG56_16735 [Terracidiphilus sp.]|jgi:hypothetical protein
MELLLNVAWGLLAGLMICLWLQFAARDGEGVGKRRQFVALAVLLMILFPVISVTDDLRAALNPAEADSCLRRDYGCAVPHSIFPAVACMPLPAAAGPSFGFLRMATPGSLDAPIFENPALAPIQNQPPPVV